MKVRIGVGLGTLPASGGNGSTATGAGGSSGFAGVIDRMAELGFDSIWLPEILTAPTLDPLTGLSFAAARHPRLKLGTTMLLPGRNLVRLAKELATLDVLSDGRLLVTLVPGIPRSRESAAAGVNSAARGERMDEMLPLLRRLWAGETVTHDGPAARLEDVRVEPVPFQQPLEVWTGGLAPAALERCGRLADGWLPSACTPEEVADRRPAVDEAAVTSRAKHQPRALRRLHRLFTHPPRCRHHPAVLLLAEGCRSRRSNPCRARRFADHPRAVLGRGLLEVRGSAHPAAHVVDRGARSPRRRRARPADLSR